MTDDELPLEGIMDREKLETHRKTLLTLKTKIMNGAAFKSTDDLKVHSEDLADETDLASSVMGQQISFNIRERELEKLRLIEEALYRIEDGTYGVCEECDEKIAEKRLSHQPWTTLCITHAEEKEREGYKFIRTAI